ncbi:MAG: formylglycine-generating enzyme family protein, partial [Gammaproteobacteria bacterium]
MGCSPGHGQCEDDERPVHTVSIKPFRMGKYEVTVGQFRQFVEAAGYRTDAERGEACS